MSYTRTTWQNGETALSAANMNNIEDGIEEALGIVQEIYDIIYPIGSIYMSIGTTDPATLFPGTTWTRIKDKFLLCAGDTYSNGATGGSADAIVVSHTHIQNAHTHTQNAHTHTQNSHNHTQNAHTHTQNAHNHYAANASDRYVPYVRKGSDTSAQTAFMAVSSGSYGWAAGVQKANTGGWVTTTGSTTASNQNATATNTATTATNQNTTATNQNATATNQTTGESGTGKNMPPYLAVNVWQRTA